MSHYAVVAPPLYSHVRALQALAQALIARGHRITFIQQADAAGLLNDPRIAFHPVGAASHPPGSLAHTLRLAANPAGLAILRLIKDMAASTDMLCRTLPTAFNQLAIDGVIADQMEPAGGLVAEALGLPFVSVACALPLNREPGLPLPVMPFDYATDERALTLYASSQKVYDWMMRGHGRVIARHARTFGLPPRHGLHECLSPLAQISQTLPALDFPRQALPPGFHAVGPLRPPATAAHPAEAWPVDPARPLVYASLGTLQGHRYGLFRTLARACRSLDAQLLVAHCGGLTPAQAESLYACGATHVTDFADQPAVLRQAQAVITHGGLNTVMDAVSSGTPILVIPIAFDQPGVAARVVYQGIGRRVSRFACRRTLADNLYRLLEDPGYRQQMAPLRVQIRQAGGAVRAAAIVEQALYARRPVLAEAVT
ncbi:zeaxanthin glucosyltransferase [Chimaeribacter californicus]|uniref:Zeaxanthin glucosyltransferase n=1 Tax=Chimaeribacter californicus TaxID=2060067 RepID=A0A2N5EA38_9GAMM|nr:glycosyltransferase [Chimaeribacter californicus]PLR38752.1 zeaxanthin glucosyltransferase [Chimaeribacter californicus]